MHLRPRLAVATIAALTITLAAASAFADSVSRDPFSPNQWALPKIKAPAAWTKTTGQGVLVGVVDSGVDLSHEDLAGQVAQSTNCIGSHGDPRQCKGNGQDDYGHGTHVSGIIAALKDNGRGIAGVAPGAKLVVAKALDSSGSGRTDDINGAIMWVVDHGAKVVNLSLGENVFITQVLGTDLGTGVEYAWQHGAVAVLTAGNQQALGFGSAEYGSIDAIVVGATGPQDEVAGYSSPTGNAKWAVVAPGGDGHDALGQPTCSPPQDAACIISTFWSKASANGYRYDEGTSMAAPHVSATLALLMSQGLTPAQAVERLLATVDRSVSCGINSANCHGRLDAGAAVGATAVVGTTPAGSGHPQPAPAQAPATVARVAPSASVANSANASPSNTVAPAGASPAPPPGSANPAVAGADQQASGGVPPATIVPKKARSNGLAMALASVAAAAVALIAGYGAWRTRRRAIAPPTVRSPIQSESPPVRPGPMVRR